MKRALIVLVLLAVALPAPAQEMPIPAGLQAKIFIKVLLFDKNYERKTEGGIVVAVLYQNGFRRSFLAKEEFVAAVADWRDESSGTVTFTCALIDLDGREDLSAALARAGADILYVAPLRSFDIGRIAKAAKDMRLPAFTGVPDYLNEGLAVSLDLREDKPRILINLKAAREAGAEFDSRVLSLARIIEGGEGSGQ